MVIDANKLEFKEFLLSRCVLHDSAVKKKDENYGRF